MSARPYDVPDRQLEPVFELVSDERIEHLQEIADDLQFAFKDSFVEITIYTADPVYADAELSDHPTLYSLRIKPKQVAS